VGSFGVVSSLIYLYVPQVRIIKGDFLSGNEYLAPGNKGHQGKTSTGYVHVLRTLDSKILGYFTFQKPGKVEVVIKPPK